MKSAHLLAYERSGTYRSAKRRVFWSRIALGAMMLTGLVAELAVGAWIAP